MRINIALLMVILSLACTGKDPLNKEKTRKEFLLYDAMQFRNKPNLEEEGLKPIILLYEFRLTMPDPVNAGKVISDPAKIVTEAKKAAQKPTIAVSTDIEQWFGDASISADEMAERFRLLFDAFKKENPNVRIGNYGIAPSNLNVFRFYDKQKTSNDPLIQKWRSNNEKRFAAMKYVDIILPSLYIPEPNIGSWREDFITTINEIKLHNDKKPIIVYLWPAYYDAPWSEFNRLIVSPEIWKAILETAYEYADGAIIWASNVDKEKKVIYWSDPKVQAIWQVTKEFIKEKELKNSIP